MQTELRPATPLVLGIRYGLLLAVCALLVDFIVKIAGFSFTTFGIVTLVGSIIVSAVWIVVAHKAFKQINGGMMTFGQGVLMAVIMLGISGLLGGVFNYIYLNYIDPDFVEQMKIGMTEFMERNNMPEEQIEKSAANFDNMKTGFAKSLLSGIGNGLVTGLIMGLLVSGFTKHKPSEFE